MCIIIIKQKGKEVKQSTLENSAVINPDGLGIVWLDTYEVTYHNSTDWRELITDRPYIAHFRYATVGKINRENTHPFVCGKQTDELLMMNGTIKGLGNDEKTDSRVLAENLGDIPRADWKAELEQHASRFVSINLKNKTFQIYNKNFYTLKDGVWFSKDNVLQDNLVAVYGTLKKGYSNYHRFLGGAKYIGSGETKDKYPLLVSGLPYLIEKKGLGHHVNVDVFKVTDSELANLDALEGHPRWYVRKQIPVLVGTNCLTKQKIQYTCWVYFNPKNVQPTDILHKSFLPQRQVKSTPTPVTQDECTQLSYWDEELYEDKETPICIECFNDIQSDGYGHHHCDSCDAWYTDNEVSMFN